MTTDQTTTDQPTSAPASQAPEAPAAPVTEQSRHRRPRRIALVTTSILLGSGLVLGGCSQSSNDRSSEVQATQAPQSADGSEASATATAPADAQGKKSTARQVTVAEPRLARKATVDLRVKDIDKAAAAIRATAETAKGSITSEEISADDEYGWGQIVISVPATGLDDTLDELGDIGEVTRRTSSTTDESSSYTDTQTRIKTMRASIARVQRLIDSTEDIDQLVTLENELSTRQADLESLLAQLEDLKDRTTMSPVTISLSKEGTPADDTSDEGGFLAGLSAGWDAFLASLRVALTALGAILPFAVLGAVLVTPVVLWWRRRRTTRRAAALPAVATGPTPDGGVEAVRPQAPRAADGPARSQQ